MKLNLDFVLYKGKTRLKFWWKAVKANFEAVQTAHNALAEAHAADKTALETTDNELASRIEQEENTRMGEVQDLSQSMSQETRDRQSADSALSGRIDSEAAAREAADSALGARMNAEAAAREEADNSISAGLRKEKQDRAEADRALDERILIAEGMAHTHDNKPALDAIDAQRISKWDTIADGTITRAEYLEHVSDASLQIKMLWELLGLYVYDGGVFGTAQTDEPLDGGGFDAAALSPLDCGGFNAYIIPAGEIGAVVDGGSY